MDVHLAFGCSPARPRNVHFRHTARLINALIAAQKPYQLLLFPNAAREQVGCTGRTLEKRPVQVVSCLGGGARIPFGGIGQPQTLQEISTLMCPSVSSISNIQSGMLQHDFALQIKVGSATERLEMNPSGIRGWRNPLRKGTPYFIVIGVPKRRKKRTKKSLDTQPPTVVFG